jgi:DNA-binding HxlR family transcriptional regulator
VGKRSYQQYCGLAAALDVVGERWALLIVRDLMPGPRRYTDLLAGLPGMATDVLAERLRSLEAAGAVVHTELTHPVPAKVYDLTERGRQLARITSQLAQWGSSLLPDPVTADHRMNPRWALQSMVARYAGGLDDGELGWTIDGVDLTVRIDGDTATLRYGPPTASPLVHVRCDTATFFRLLAGRGQPSKRSDIDVTGRRELVTPFFNAMPLPLRTARPATTGAAAE